MTGTNEEKAHYKRIQRARRVAEGMVRCEVWLSPHEAAVVDWARDLWEYDRAAVIKHMVCVFGEESAYAPYPHSQKQVTITP